jgi:hypothetical protein
MLTFFSYTRDAERVGYGLLVIDGFRSKIPSIISEKNYGTKLAT